MLRSLSVSSLIRVMFVSMISLSDSSISIKVTFAPNKSAPMPRMPVPAPRSRTCFPSSNLLMCASQMMVAAASDGVGYCSSRVFGFGNRCSLDKSTASVALLILLEKDIIFINGVVFSCSRGVSVQAWTRLVERFDSPGIGY